MSGKRKRADGLPENPLEGLPLTGALSKQVADSTVVNQQPAKEGGAIKRKKPTQLGVLIEAGTIADGALLRYMKGTGLSYSGKLMAVGRARMDGVEVHGNSSLLGMSGFEAYAKSTAHRPAQFTFTSSGQSLQQLQQQHAGDGGASVRKPPGKWGMTAEGRATHYPAPKLMTDLNDEVCRICWQGGDLLCCETCPAVMHAQCAGLTQAPMGDWHCPSCTCAACGHPATEPADDPTPLQSQAILIEPASGPDDPVWRGPLNGEKSEPVVTMSAYGFDTLWPREGALAARMQLQAQEQADRAAQAAAAAAAAAQLRGRPPSARLAQRGPSASAEAPATHDAVAPIKEEPSVMQVAPSRGHVEQLPASQGAGSGHEDVKAQQPESSLQATRELLHISTPASGADHSTQEPAQARSAVAAVGGQAMTVPEQDASPGRALRSPQGSRAPAVPPKPTGDAMAPEASTGKLQRAARAAHSRQEVVSILDDMFPPTTSAAKGKLLREAFAAVCPGEPWKGRVVAIRQMAEGLWDAQSGAKSGSPAPAQQSERQRRRGAGALMSATLAAELSNDAALDDEALQPDLTVAAGFLQVDGADDLSPATEQLPDASAAHGVPLQPPAGLPGSDQALPQALSSLPAPQGGSQATVSEGQRLLCTMKPVSAAPPEACMPPYVAAAQLPAAQQLGGQHLMPHAETLTAALQQQVGTLSRLLGPSEGVRQALQRQMWALQQQNKAALQQPGLPAAQPGPYMAPKMPAQVPVHYASSPGQAGQQPAQSWVPQPAAQLSQPAPLKRAAPAHPKSKGAPKRAKQAPAPPASSAEPAQSALGSQAPMAAQAVGQAPDTQRPLPAAAGQEASRAGPPADAQLPAAAGGAADGHVPALIRPIKTDPEVAATRPLSAGFDSAAEAVAAYGMPNVPAGQQPSGAGAALVSCAGCGARWHAGCLPQKVQQEAKRGTWFHSETCRVVDAHMAKLAVSGLMPVQSGSDATHAPKLAWQLIRGAAVSSPKDCRGHAPLYEEGTRGTLRETLYAVRHLFHEAMGPLQDSRTGQDLLPMLIQGKVLQRRLLDFSSFHTAVLWLGPSIVAGGVTRMLGAEVAELPALAVRPELQGNSLGRLLVALLESAAREAGAKLIAMPALVPFPSSSPKQAPTPDGPMTAAVIYEQVPTWAKALGYRQATCSELARLSTLPLLHFSGAQFAVKELADATALEIKAPAELHFNEEADEQEYWRARLLQPAGLAAYTAQRARVDSQVPPTAAAGKSEQAAGETGEAGLDTIEQAPEEGAAALKSDIKQEHDPSGQL